MKASAWLLAAALFAPAAYGDVITGKEYDFHLDAFTFNGQTYSPQDFSILENTPLGPDTGPAVPEIPTSSYGNAIADIGVIAYTWGTDNTPATFSYMLGTNYYSDGRGTPGQVTGVWTPFIDGFLTDGPLNVPVDTGNTEGSGFAVLIADGCMSATQCGNGYNIVTHHWQSLRARRAGAGDAGVDGARLRRCSARPAPYSCGPIGRA